MAVDSSSKINIYVPFNVTEMHMVYGDAEKDGLSSKCITVDIRSSFISFNIVTEVDSPLKVIQIWYKPPLRNRVNCTMIMYYVNNNQTIILNPGVKSNVYYDSLECVSLGANVALDKPDFANESFSSEISERYLGTCDVFDIEKCEFCSWTGSWVGMDNHYMEFHANRQVLEDPFDNFDRYFPN